jgi:hypothetical protein
MKHLILTSLLLLGMVQAEASSLRMDGQLIRAGSPVTDLLRLVGYPEFRTQVYTRGSDNSPEYEIWQYRINDLNYEFRIRGGRIEKIDWSRF